MDDTSDIGDFVRVVVEEWGLNQLMNYAIENLNDFYNQNKDIFEMDYKLFMADHSAPDYLNEIKRINTDYLD